MKRRGEEEDSRRRERGEDDEEGRRGKEEEEWFHTNKHKQTCTRGRLTHIYSGIHDLEVDV